MTDLRAELERLRQENARLRRLLKLTDAEAAPARGTQSAWFDRAPGQVDTSSSPQAKVEFYAAFFGARRDVYAVRWENARTGKSGWMPAVEGGWRKGRSASDIRHLPLTPEVLAAHLTGDVHIGLYPMLAGDQTCWLAADFDGQAAMLDALAYLKAARAVGAPAALEVSRSGIGAHVWVFFTDPVPAATARQLGTALVREAIAIRGRMALRCYDRLFPSQDVLPGQGPGNLIAAPLHGRSRKVGTTVFLDLATLEPFEDQWEYLSTLERLTPKRVTKLASALREPTEGWGTRRPCPACPVDQDEGLPEPQGPLTRACARDDPPRSLAARSAPGLGGEAHGLAEAALQLSLHPTGNRCASPTCSPSPSDDGGRHDGARGELPENKDLPRHAESGYYREMTGVLRTLTLPSEGYGDEPRSEADVLLTSAARIQAALPTGWTVQAKTEVGGLDVSTNTSRRPDSRLSLMREGKTVLAYVVEAKRALASNYLLPAINQLLAFQDARPANSTRIQPMLVARYLSPQQQRVLQERGIAYADATGNLYLTSNDPLILLSDRGASADPWRGPGRPTTSLKGLPAARLVRALADFIPPYSVADLADLSDASLGAAYRLSDYLAGQGLLTRGERGPIMDVDWPELLRRWSQEARYLDTSTTRGFLEPRGLDSLVEKLAKQTPAQRYAVSGSLATQPYASYAEARLGLIYADDPLTLASGLGLRPVETGANVILVAPRSPVVFERTSTWRDITIVAPSQAVADLLGGPGRNPAEGDYLLDWMKENPDAWRRQLDR